VGYRSLASGDGSFAAGTENLAEGLDSVSVGVGNEALADRGVAIGVDNLAEGPNSMALGLSSEALGVESLAAGALAQAAGEASVAIGRDAFAGSLGSVAIGDGAQALSSVAVGTGATASGTNSTAIGDNAVASGAQAVALGNDASASGDNSVAIGAGSVASGDDEVSFGAAGSERRLSNVAAGVNPTDVANMQQLSQVNNQVQAHSLLIEDNRRLIDANRQAIQGLDRKLKNVRDEANAGVAAALALAPIVPPMTEGQTAVMGGVGYYEGSSAVGVSVTHQLKSGQRSVYLNGGVSVTSENTVGTRAMIGVVF
jgi:autotransporter adhesin